MNGRSSILGLTDPAIVELGLIGANEFHLAVDRTAFWDSYWGPLFDKNIIVTGTVDNGNEAQTHKILKEFFEEICEAAGKERPNNWYNFPPK